MALCFNFVSLYIFSRPLETENNLKWSVSKYFWEHEQHNTMAKIVLSKHILHVLFPTWFHQTLIFKRPVNLYGFGSNGSFDGWFQAEKASVM